MKKNINLGISIYPEKTNISEINDYLKLAKKYDFSLVFINFISILEKKDIKLLSYYKEVISLCQKNGFEVTLDVNKSTFDELKIDYNQPDLKYFADMGIDCLRLDDQFNGLFEATLTFNKYGIKIELNPSTFNDQISNILSYGANVNNLRALHNFYPQKYSALNYELFKKHNKKIISQGLDVGAFITINTHSTVGPWEVNEFLPTLEIHRDLDIGIQANHFISNNFVKYLYISTQFASEKDFMEITNSISPKKIIPYKKLRENSKIENQVIDFDNHFIRGDMSENIIRSTITRKIYSTENIQKNIFSENIIKKGYVVIPNDEYAKYKGELQIVSKDIINDNLRNVVGYIPDKFHFLIDELKPWDHFELKEYD
ncbi:outer surface protein [Mesoplasma florum]|uniref:MupG family TIM beta-alpha barrel fold protein n=1 Tax=Mesoplasma florum TaxID=2151 RepID=UPI000D02F6EB|nr:MupG family TIM beta-alpha barrel fold protein [Mesoplasma florum]AVN63675.1 outer surface protein [Mesoplasma florum]